LIFFSRCNAWAYFASIFKSLKTTFYIFFLLGKLALLFILSTSFHHQSHVDTCTYFPCIGSVFPSAKGWGWDLLNMIFFSVMPKVLEWKECFPTKAQIQQGKRRGEKTGNRDEKDPEQKKSYLVYFHPKSKNFSRFFVTSNL